VSDFATILIFLGFCHSLKKIAKETEENKIKECVIGVNI
jgi:hypothetical protein